MNNSFKLIRNFAFLTGLLLASAVAMAEEDKCVPQAEESTGTCRNVVSTMHILDSKIGAAAASMNHEGINDGAVAQSAALEAELQSFPIIAKGCESAAIDCESACPEKPELCRESKMHAASVAMQLGSMQTAFSKTQKVDKATEEIEVAGGATYSSCPGGSYSNCVFTVNIVDHLQRKAYCQAKCPYIGQ